MLYLELVAVGSLDTYKGSGPVDSTPLSSVVVASNRNRADADSSRDFSEYLASGVAHELLGIADAMLSWILTASSSGLWKLAVFSGVCVLWEGAGLGNTGCVVYASPGLLCFLECRQDLLWCRITWKVSGTVKKTV